MEIESNKRIVMDIDGVIAEKDPALPYSDRRPVEDVLNQLKRYSERGYYIILYTARNMNSFDGRVGKINAETAPTLLEWLDEHDVPFEEIHYGKPWCGHDGFYVDDRAIRPSEFLERDADELVRMIETESR